MPKKLTEQVIINEMRSQWNQKLTTLKEDVELTFKDKNDKDEQPLVSSGLKVKNKKSGIRYTVDSVSPNNVVLKTPEGDKKFIVDRAKLEDDYVID